MASPGPVFFVALDGTLVATDLAWEAFLSASRKAPGASLRAARDAALGRGGLARSLALTVAGLLDDDDVRHLPFRPEVLTFLRERRSEGVRLVLVAPGLGPLARRVTDGLGLFDDVIGEESPSRGPDARLAAIDDYSRSHGLSGFSYLGNAPGDLPIWDGADRAYAAAPGPAARRALRRLDRPPEVLAPGRPPLRALARALRPEHWVKNLLLAVPVVLSHQLFDTTRWLPLALAFLTFSAVASAIYVFNDLSDVASDRRHPTKRRRPFASGQLPLAYGPALSGVLLVTGFGVATAALPGTFVACLALYLGLNLLYSSWLKRKLVIDVLVLAGFYALRILAGGYALAVTVSEWLLSFSIFFFLSLAFAKRQAELLRLARSNGGEPAGRAFQVSDIGMIESFGPSSGYLAVLVLALYINSPQVKELYTYRAPLWCLCPLLLYWVSRVWFLTARGVLSEDPVVFAMKDRVSLAVGVVSFALVMLAAWGR